MVFRIFIALVVLANILFAVQIYQLSRAHAMLAEVPAGYSIGPADADITVVEFFDYACPHCATVDPVIMEAVKRDGHVRYVPRPIVSPDPDGTIYSRAVYAAGLQGKFIEMHRELIGDFRVLNERRKDELAAKTGIDAKKFRADMESKDVQASLDRNMWLIRYFYSKSVPHFIIGGKIKFSPGAHTPSVEDFLEMFKEARSG